MKIAVAIIAIYAIAAVFLIVSYQRPGRIDRKLTGRGGDFES
jgi:hypothetical protein